MTKPEAVLSNWDIVGLDKPENLKLEKSTHGLLNQVFLFRAGGSDNELFVLQAVHPAVSMDGAMHNYFNVTQFLKEQGMVAQSLVLTKAGSIWVEDGELTGWRWRLLKGVPGRIYTQTNDVTLAREAGKMLASFHSVMSKYPNELEEGRKSFRYENEIKKLNEYKERLMTSGDESIKSSTELILENLPKLMLPSDLPKRIIHADPKISNFVFSDEKKAICMIDLDTVQVLSPLYDLGDALRSWCGKKEDDPSNTFNHEVAKAFLDGYFSNSKDFISERERALIPQTTKMIILGLASRFLNDYIDDSYFGWDETRYESRKAHNKARALGQVALFKSFEGISTTIDHRVTKLEQKNT